MNYTPSPQSQRPPPIIDWGLSDNTELEVSPESRAVAQIAQQLSQYLSKDPDSDEKLEERSDDGGDQDVEEPTVAVDKGDEFEEPDHGQKRARTRDHTAYSRQWYPWSDRITCTLDVLMHLPRSVFSHRQLELFLWLLKVNNVDDVPSVKSMQELNAMLQKLCGIESIAYDGALGHKYYVNSLAQILAQFYPEDSGKRLEEARQGTRWLEEMPADKTTPMARIGKQDYFIHEPAMLVDGTFCMPVRWFVRDKTLVAKCWDLVVVNRDGGEKWRVIQRETEVSQEKFIKNFPTIKTDLHLYNVPDPGVLSDWELTDPAVGNPWRERAKGSRVFAFPIWLYCDDTSGNLSKKWNEHNSFLFTPAGLPREESQKEFNIHFLCTSNIAPPLEMLDGILDQLETAQKDGVWAWDSTLNELVLLVPTVLALLGDNPMQSEFACHIGLRGKYFCRACWVKGSDSLDNNESDAAPPPPPGGPQTAVGSDAESQVGSDAGSETSQNSGGSGKKSKGGKRIGKLRNKTETKTKLRSYFEEASTLHTKTKVEKMRTASGIKDTFQLVFLEKLFDSYKTKRGKEARQAALDAEKRKLPNNTTSPVWRIEGLDPHHDTPVEILHVILLGFVKYLWRDLVQNQLGSNAEKKALLVTRLNSFDVSGLGISPLAGHTLVQYSGSLTGRDFRAIAQAAPFVVYDLVSKDCLATWVALSKLIPLVWQPIIKDVDAHVALLTAEINHFLTCAARWTTRWFNKPKFHILLHLPEHIRRFGPASLFATEAFESFNAIIRAKSVHSNRHAPSRDIARAFAQGNRIRHLLSGGLFMQPSLISANTSSQGRLELVANRNLSPHQKDWVCAGRGPMSLVATPNTLPPRSFATTLTGDKLPHSLAANSPLLKTNAAVYLDNGDFCPLDQFVIARRPDRTTFVARVKEILQIMGTVEDLSRRASAILLQSTTIGTAGDPSYEMPAVGVQNQWSLVQMTDILCTVNVQHNCNAQHCGPTGFRYIYQERETTTHTRPVIVHAGVEDDFVLNTGQMRDAINLQPFRTNSQVLDMDTVIEASVLREFHQEKAANTSQSTASIPLSSASSRGGRGGGRGRGRGTVGASSAALPATQRLSQLQGESFSSSQV
ncbi:hypothetical protein B0H16DRAFT_1331027 [Mycena metata]|uniref:Uncharacterized protein n=1 Tax=Mycena metata TaxID=1033252 RepID=A0AAD7HU95_9AGAR|nr:hypothetical protein B0H16DRAFT_1331027 [Mycena metata]